jgi:hypothetical protein
MWNDLSGAEGRFDAGSIILGLLSFARTEKKEEAASGLE